MLFSTENMLQNSYIDDGDLSDHMISGWMALDGNGIVADCRA